MVWLSVMGIWKCLVADYLIWVSNLHPLRPRFLLQTITFVVFLDSWNLALGLGSMSSIAISYGENGPVFCGLKSDGTHVVTCYGSNSAIIFATPSHFAFAGLTAGNGFVCGLLIDSDQPYCWGSSGFIEMGVPQPMVNGSEYLEISAGDHHLCGLRKPLRGRRRNTTLVDCWGYNMTASHVFAGQIRSISAGSEFNCGLFSQNRTVFCWGDETSSRVISLIPKETRFQKIAAGGFHVCGILEGIASRVFCWGRSLNLEEEIVSVARSGHANVDLAPKDPMLTVVGGRFHACGVRSYDRGVACWGYSVESSTPPPTGIRLYEIAAGDYFTCGVLAERSLLPICWGAGFPSSLPLAVSPGLCKSEPCEPGFYAFNNGTSSCKFPNSHICLPCTKYCPNETYQKAGCTSISDRLCEFNCSSCVSAECYSNCSYSNGVSGKKNVRFWSLQLPVIVAEIAFLVFLVSVVSLTAIFYVRYKLRNCRCSASSDMKSQTNNGTGNNGSFQKDSCKIRPDLDDLKIRRAQMFTYEELERATGGFKDESQVGKGSFSCVFKGVLKDGTVVAVKRAIMSPDMKKNSKEFHTELDLLSRLNHAHLLNLLGYCEEGGERLLVYEFMANGSLHQHLHGKSKASKEQLDWVRRVTIAVQAARGIEYLHGYACPPVIHRDIKSSNILIDEEHNARVADFGLSLLGPANSSSPLAELPAGTLGYLDPEYYRLHYLTTKSDVYSFGVLLLEILSGRKAIDMQFEEGNIVEWAVPLIKAGDIQAILDPALKPPADIEALKRIANVACKCVRMRGKERPSMDKVTTSLERALAVLMGSPSNDQPILPTEVVLGSSRLHKKSSQRSSNRSVSETDGAETEDQRFEFRAPSWITFPSVTSSQRRKSSVSEADVDVKNTEVRNLGNGGSICDGLRSLEEEIGPASPQENLFLKHNF
ncbi:Serine/threonine-protein kinase-like protein acr4 [Sarracenia purpurea var. burkii]